MIDYPTNEKLYQKHLSVERVGVREKALTRVDSYGE